MFSPAQRSPPARLTSLAYALLSTASRMLVLDRSAPTSSAPGRAQGRG